ncbi:MAG: hypothetical protein LBG96_12180 [Tannerella sp.]|nr:hypothetical protein [Tannerella sp.]
MDNGKAKQALFSLFYRNWHIEKFNDFGVSFISTIDHCVRQDVYRTLKKHVMNGHKVIIVSASIETGIVMGGERRHRSRDCHADRGRATGKTYGTIYVA